ncbi:MAG TPA: nitrilase-related carbon-nitrogen hydrolase [Chitinophagales bacterium]|nr:nitrilase-related carbon-nitrogen hydrolase [Chitinophagales bacterium]
MQNEISIVLVQTDLIWKDKKANLSNLENLISSIETKIDIIVLPEMFSTAFCVDDMSLAEDINGETIIWMKHLAKETNSAICGSILFKENELFYNRFLFVEPNGKIHHYNKHHLFSLVGEEKNLTNENKKILIQYKDWKIQAFICYDIRFPAWCVNYDNADIQIYVANWPKKRSHHWRILLQARAIENQCYTIGVNRIGNDFYNNEHDGCSAVFDFTGTQLSLLENTNGIEIVTLSKDELETHKLRYPFWKDR